MLTALVSLLVSMAATAPPRAVPDTATLLTTLGQDTIAVERYQWTPRHLQGDILLRAPRTVRYHYVITFQPDGALAHSMVDFTAPGMSHGPEIRTTITVTGDTARVEVNNSGVVKTSTHAVSPNIMP
ncbi:MAG: hypothetical protein ACREN3_07010, partial [Gemmatimonadaceae bacterium]